MGITPETEKFFETIKSQPAPTWDMSDEEFIAVRKSMVEGFQELADTSLASGVSMKELKLPVLDGELTMLELTPETCAFKSPTLIYFPGGGFVLDLGIHQSACSKIAKVANCKVLLVKCSLAPEHKYPRGPREAFEAIQYLHNHADEYGLDPKWLAVGGDSSGGNYAALAVNRLQRKRPDIKLRCQLLISPNVDLSLKTYKDTKFKFHQEQDIIVSEPGIVFCRRLYLPDDVDLESAAVSPLFDTVESLPPTLISCGEYDGVRGDAEAYFDKLKSLGCQVERILWLGQVHNSMICRKIFSDGPDPAEIIGAALGERYLNRDMESVTGPGIDGRV